MNTCRTLFQITETCLSLCVSSTLPVTHKPSLRGTVSCHPLAYHVVAGSMSFTSVNLDLRANTCKSHSPSPPHCIKHTLASSPASKHGMAGGMSQPSAVLDNSVWLSELLLLSQQWLLAKLSDGGSCLLALPQ